MIVPVQLVVGVMQCLVSILVGYASCLVYIPLVLVVPAAVPLGRDHILPVHHSIVPFWYCIAVDTVPVRAAILVPFLHVVVDRSVSVPVRFGFGFVVVAISMPVVPSVVPLPQPCVGIVHGPSAVVGPIHLVPFGWTIPVVAIVVPRHSILDSAGHVPVPIPSRYFECRSNPCHIVVVLFVSHSHSVFVLVVGHWPSLVYVHHVWFDTIVHNRTIVVASCRSLVGCDVIRSV